VTKKARGQECRWCRRPIDRAPGRGRPKEFCRAACRQAAYRARQLAAGHGLADGEVVVRQQALDELADAQYVLASALEDLEADLAGAPTKAEIQRAVVDLVDACGPLASLRLRPVTER
jgi:hypothetical protein